jgi:hypothetical protein
LTICCFCYTMQGPSLEGQGPTKWENTSHIHVCNTNTTLLGTKTVLVLDAPSVGTFSSGVQKEQTLFKRGRPKSSSSYQIMPLSYGYGTMDLGRIDYLFTPIPWRIGVVLLPNWIRGLENFSQPAPTLRSHQEPMRTSGNVIERRDARRENEKDANRKDSPVIHGPSPSSMVRPRPSMGPPSVAHRPSPSLRSAHLAFEGAACAGRP